MKIAIIIESRDTMNPVKAALEQVLKLLADGEFVAPAEADLVIAQNPADLLAALKAGKRAIQFIMSREQSRAEGLLTAPDFADRFRIFHVIDGGEMFKYIASLAKEG